MPSVFLYVKLGYCGILYLKIIWNSRSKFWNKEPTFYTSTFFYQTQQLYIHTKRFEIVAKINCFSSRPTLAFSYELNYGSPHEMQQKNVFYKWFHIIIILCCADCTNIKTICDVRVVIKDCMWSKIIQNCVKQTTLTHKYCNLNLRIKLSPLRIERMQQKISGFYTHSTLSGI